MPEVAVVRGGIPTGIPDTYHDMEDSAERRGDGASIRFVSRDQIGTVLAKMPNTVKIK
jgi:hypothetical protein